MHYIPLGDTDLRVSRLCLGCMTFGEPDRGNHAWTLPEESSRPLIKHALEGYLSATNATPGWNPPAPGSGIWQYQNSSETHLLFIYHAELCNSRALPVP